jgi:hypothetical protein
VRWYRPGWARGRDGANRRYFLDEAAARRMAAKVTAHVTAAGPAVVEVASAPVGPWERER